MKEWEKEGQPEFDFSDCYIANYPPLDLSARLRGGRRGI